MGTRHWARNRAPAGTRRSLALPPSGGAAAVAWVGRCLLKSRNCVRLHRVPFECPPASSRHYSWVYLAAKRSPTWATPCYLCCAHGLRALAYLRRMMTVGSRAHRLHPRQWEQRRGGPLKDRPLPPNFRPYANHVESFASSRIIASRRCGSLGYALYLTGLGYIKPAARPWQGSSPCSPPHTPFSSSAAATLAPPPLCTLACRPRAPRTYVRRPSFMRSEP